MAPAGPSRVLLLCLHNHQPVGNFDFVLEQACRDACTGADYVLHLDPWWNPAVEAQAIDRTHRIGQTQTVNAYRLISPGTVEEKIWELQQSKAQTIADVLGEEGFARSLSKADLEYLFAED